MSDFNNIGKLMHLRLVDIEPGQSSESEFIINAAAEAVCEAGGRNWIPVIVKETADYQYQVVSHNFVYTVAQQAALERVWCIVIEPETKSIEQAKILSREAVPKVNLTVASGDIILAALKYLVAEPGSALKGLDIIKAANRITSADRATWTSLSPITALKCGITKGKKLDALTEVFFLSPPLPVPPPPQVISIKSASRDEIFARLSYLSTYKIGGFQAVDPETTADAIFTASKGRWKSLNPISKLECGIDAVKIKTLKTAFAL